MNALTRPHVRSRLGALAVALSLAAGVSVIAPAVPASAIDYPSWNDVEAVRDDQAATDAAVQQIKGLLGTLQAEAARTQADAEAKGTAWQTADDLFQTANVKQKALQAQADEASALAAASKKRAGQMAAQMMRGGGEDLTAKLLLDSANADNLLYGLGMSGRITEQANDIFTRAQFDLNNAQALTDQAEVAKKELETLKVAAEEAFAEASAASVAAAAALDAQRANAARLEQQLVVLTEKRAATEADYLAGVQATIAAEASLAAGQISTSGWAKPSGGYISSAFGWRILYGRDNFHKGTDLAGGCGANIYAASSGRVSYAAYGWNGGYGNEIMIDHGNGIVTRYGHIVDDGILVSSGQSIGVGTNIAQIGTTGDSTGCHLHFEVIVDGAVTDPVSFMADQGITLG